MSEHSPRRSAPFYGVSTMHVATKSAISRLEAAGKHAPSLATLDHKAFLARARARKGLNEAYNALALAYQVAGCSRPDPVLALRKMPSPNVWAPSTTALASEGALSGVVSENGLQSTLRVGERPQSPELARLGPGAAAPEVVAGQVDVLPAQRRQVSKQRVVDGPTVGPQGGDSTLQVHGVP